MKININPDLETYRQDMLSKVDREAEDFRHLFITPGSGQAIVYLVKEQEARAVLVNPAAIVPHITTEAQVRGVPAADLAQIVITMADEWRGLSAKIEGLRMGTKLAIEGATTVADVLAASNPNWESLPWGPALNRRRPP